MRTGSQRQLRIFGQDADELMAVVAQRLGPHQRAAPELWDRLVEAGTAFGIAPFGIEALMTLRIEKGYIHVGSDSDGTTLPGDLGMAGGIARKA